MASRSDAEVKAPARRTVVALVRVGSFVGGIALYLLATLLSLAAGWWLPGRGIDTIAARVVLGCATPAVVTLTLLHRLRRSGHRLFATALLVGMILMGLACVGAAIGIVFGFRILDS